MIINLNRKIQKYDKEQLAYEKNLKNSVLLSFLLSHNELVG